MEDDVQLVEGGLYSLTHPISIYDYEHESNLMVGHMGSSFLGHEHSINGEPMGIYLGTQRVTFLTSHRRGRGKTIRKLVHVFFWGGVKVVLSPEYVVPVDTNSEAHCRQFQNPAGAA